MGTAVDLSLVDITGDGRRWTTCMYGYPDAGVHIHGIVACPGGSPPALAARDVLVYMTLRGNVPTEMTVCWGPTRSWCDMRIRRGFITLSLVDDEDTRRVALLQAVLSGFCGPTFDDVGRSVGVRCEARFPSPTCTESGVQNQVAPLVPLASHLRFAAWVGGKGPVKKFAQSRKGVRTADSGITLWVSRSHHEVCFTDLQRDLQGYIFASLPAVDLAHVALTCTTFHSVLAEGWR
jgi:hypothetical protein